MWSGKRVLVPGGAGFLGSFVVPKLRELGASVRVPKRESYDFRSPVATERAFNSFEPHIVINLVGSVGGLPHNAAHPADLFVDNILPGINLLMAAKKAKVEKFVQIGSICEYPNEAKVPFRESDLWNGYPEPTNAPYGIAKRAILALGQALRKQYGLCAVHVLLANLYGPGDDFSESSHVIPGMITKLSDWQAVLFGSGRPTREFLYVDDAAEAIITIAEYYDSPEPINVGSGDEISMAELAGFVADAVGHDGNIFWDKTKPDGQMRRAIDSTKILSLGWRPKVDLIEGLNKTVAWYKSQRKEYAK